MEQALETGGSEAITKLGLQDVRDAVWHAVAMMMGNDAAETDVDVSLVQATARGFQCTEVADILDKTGAALEKIRAEGNRVVDSLGATPRIIQALRASREPPTFSESVLVCTGGRRFKTGRGQMYVDAWDVLHPGRRLLNSFYTDLRNHPDASLSTEVIYLVSSRSLNAAGVSQAAKTFFQALHRLQQTPAGKAP